MRSQLPCSRAQILSHLSSALIKTDHVHVNSALSQLLEKCLDSDFISGSVVGQQSIDSLTPPDVPMLILNGEYDFVVDSGSLHRWRSILKPGDYVELISQGRHFFQFSHAALVVEKINAFLDLIATNEFPDTISSLSPVSSTLQS
jgi:surfactin synthase thioesterase subunit